MGWWVLSWRNCVHSVALLDPLSYRLAFPYLGENSQEFSPTFSERIFIAGSKQYR